MKSVAKSQINMYIKGIGQWCPIIHSRSQIMTRENFIKTYKCCSLPAKRNTNAGLKGWLKTILFVLGLGLICAVALGALLIAIDCIPPLAWAIIIFVIGCVGSAA